MTASVDNKPKEEKEEVGKPLETAKKTEPAFEPDDMVTALRRNWGTRDLPPGKVDYLDEFTSVGGIIRNVPYARALAWAKRGLISKEHIFANNAKPEHFVKAMGRDPLAPENVAAAVQTLTPDKVAAILGPEASTKLARELLRLNSVREEGA